MRGCLLLTKKSRREFFQKVFAIGILWNGVSRYAAIPLNVSFYHGDSDSTRFRLWSPIAAGNCLDRAEKIQTLLRRLANLTFLIRVQSFRDPLRGELSHVQIFMNDGPNSVTWYACCSAIHLGEIRRSFKISSWTLKMSHPRCVVKIQVREESPILYSHKTQLNIKLSLLQHYNNMFRPKLSAIFRLYMKPI